MPLVYHTCNGTLSPKDDIYCVSNSASKPVPEAVSLGILVTLSVAILYFFQNASKSDALYN